MDHFASKKTWFSRGRCIGDTPRGDEIRHKSAKPPNDGLRGFAVRWTNPQAPNRAFFGIVAMATRREATKFAINRRTPRLRKGESAVNSRITPLRAKNARTPERHTVRYSWLNRHKDYLQHTYHYSEHTDYMNDEHGALQWSLAALTRSFPLVALVRHSAM